MVQVRAYFDKGAGAGTGFFVREDGWLLTNHHVVCGKQVHTDCTKKSNMKLGKRFEVVWDSTVGPKKQGQKHRTAAAQLVIRCAARLSLRFAAGHRRAHAGGARRRVGSEDARRFGHRRLREDG